MDTTEGEPPPSEPEPRIIGLTGGIGSGKTTAAQFIEESGFPVYYSDIRAKEIVNENEVLKQSIQELLGPESYDAEGLYNRKIVAEKVFGNPALLQQLNSLIHPAVRDDFEYWVRRQHTFFVFKETALLFELGLEKESFRTILVTAEDNLRIKRVMDRDGKTYRQIKSVMEQQMPEKDKMKRADFIIHNNNGIETLKKEIEQVLQALNVVVKQ